MPTKTISAAARSGSPALRRLAARVDEAFAPLGEVDGLNIEIRTADGLTIPVLFRDNGPLPENAACVRIHVDGNAEAEVVVSHPRADSEALRFGEALVHCVVRGMDLEKREELLLEELGANWEILEALYEISTDVLRTGGIKHSLRRLIERVTSMQEGLHVALFVTRHDGFEPLVSTDATAHRMEAQELGMLEQVMQHRTALLHNNLEPGEAEPASVCWSRATSVAASPLTSSQNTIGFVVAWRNDDRFAFDSFFSRLLETIAYQASMLMDSDRLNRKVRASELLAQEIEIASSIQETLLLANAPTHVPGLEAAAFSLPSQNIDGDFYDFFPHANGALDVLVGDVMGKGVAAALLGAATKSQFLRSIANLALQSAGAAPEPREIVMRSASRMSERLMTLERFVTLCYARFDMSAKRLTFIDCGHTGVIHHSKASELTKVLRSDDLPFGVLGEFDCEQHEADILPGDTFLFYSDGVTENRSPEGELFGEDRLTECVETWCSLGPSVLIRQIGKEAVRFRGSEKFSDDFTCVAIRICRGNASKPPLIFRAEEFRCDLEELARMRGWLGDLAEALPGDSLNEVATARLLLTCTELFANCVIHTGERPCLAPIRIEGLAYADEVTVRLMHPGEPYDALSVVPPSFDGSRDGGFGLFIVSRSADELVYSRDAEGTNITTISFAR